MSNVLHPRKVQRYGWKRDLPDRRDRDHKCLITKQAALPQTVDLRSEMPPVYDQGDLGSCTANATAGLAQFLMMKKWKTPSANFTPSRLFIYYNERVLEGTVSEDSGASLRDGMKVLNQIGAPHETFWPYVESKFAVKPPGNVFTDAKVHKLTSYQSVNQDHDSICSVLASGYPVVFGFTAYSELESAAVAKSGVLPMPGKNDDVVGGHAVLIVGYDESAKVYIVRNSWSADWGIQGYFSMPYDYVQDADLADDFWTSQMIS